MSKLWKKLAAAGLAGVTAAATILSGCGSASTSDEAKSVDFTWTLEQNVLSDFNIESEDGPVAKYWLSKEWNVDGETTNVNIDFYVPPEGTDVSESLGNMFATGEYTDVMSMAMSPVTSGELYEQGIIVDLLPYLDEYMPNYKAWLEANPTYASQMYTTIDGEQKLLNLYRVSDASQAPWSGFCYRRDWIVKYGTNPETGAAFTGGWNEDKTEWTDDVVFPSGGTDPVYISDWEWMLEIFAKAIEEQNIEGGYAMSMFYTGYYEAGDIVSSFNAAPQFYLDADGEYQFGGDDDAFRTYVEVMADWYANGWIEPAFDEDVSPAFFMLDTANLYGGNIGLWYGMNSMIGNALDTGASEVTDGICVYGCADPINDLYGDASCQGVDPFLVYATQGTNVQVGSVVTTKALEKNIGALLTAIDYTYSEEGGRLCYRGLSDEQQAETNDDFYNEHGLSDGAYTVEDRDGTETIVVNSAMYAEGSLENAARLATVAGLNINKNVDLNQGTLMNETLTKWAQYEDTGTLLTMVEGQLSSDDISAASTMKTNITTYMSQKIPEFIMGKTDVTDDAQWEEYVKGLQEYDPDSYCAKINAILK